MTPPLRQTVLVLVLSTALTGCLGAPSGKWYRGNTHTHSLWSDGNEFPDMIARWYVEHGYDFLVLSDHNVLSRGDRWMKLSDIQRRRNPDALDHYRAHFGGDWIETRGEGADLAVRLKTLDEVRGRFEEPGGFLMIEGEEITDAWGRAPVHINAINLAEPIKPQRGDSVRDVIRRNLIAVAEQAQRTGRPMFAHLNHPNFHYGVTAEDLAHVVEEPFFEVYNGHPGVNHQGDANHPSTERLWDIANTIRLSRLKAPPLFAVATDDSHHYHEDEANQPKHSIPGRGWVMVHAEELSAESIVNAMLAGRFYASSGVTLSSIDYDPTTRVLRLAIKPDPDRKYTVRFIGTRADHDDASEPRLDKTGKPMRATRKYSDEVGQTLAVIENVTEAEFTADPALLYVRAVVTSDHAPARPVYDGQVETAWTQPVGWEGRVEP